MRRTIAGIVAFLAAALVAACGGDGATTTTEAGRAPLVGTFKITKGACADAAVTSGSYFRMVQPGGTVPAGPYVLNGDSPCGDKTWTPLAPGTEGGLVTGSHQPQPEPAFDDKGNGAAARITAPQPWFAVSFSLATNPKDPQTGLDSPAPLVLVAGGRLSGDLRSFAAAWNGQHFNQGAPKPDGSKPGNTNGPSGTYDAATRAFTLDWASQIVSGPFNNFTGTWHLEGTFEPRA